MPLLCNDCRTSVACIICCQEALCAMHAYSTKHSGHPSLWKVVDQGELDRTRAFAETARKKAIKSLERDLQELCALRGVAVAGGSSGGGSASSSSGGGGGGGGGGAGGGRVIDYGKEASLARSTNQTSTQPIEPPSKKIKPGQGMPPVALLIPKKKPVAPQIPPPPPPTAKVVKDKGKKKGRELEEEEEGGEDGPQLASAKREELTVNPPEGQGGGEAGATTTTTTTTTATTTTGERSQALAAFRARLEAQEATSAAAAFPSLSEPARRSVAAGLWRSLQKGVLADESRGYLTEEGVYRRKEAIKFASATATTSHDLLALIGPVEANTLTLSHTALRHYAESLEGALHASCEGVEGGSSSSGGGGGGGGAAGSGGTPHHTSTYYSSQARSLMTALSDPENAALRRDFLGGGLAPGVLCVRKVGELAPPAQQARAEEIRQGAVLGSDLISAASALEIWVPLAGVKCQGCRGIGGCSGREAPGSGAQKDIRKAEVWGTSGGGDDAPRTLLKCALCGHRWESTDVKGLVA